jgi:hypothetical protein
MRLGGQRHAPAALPSRNSTGTYCTRGCVGPRASLNGCGEEEILRSYQDLNPTRPTLSESLYLLRSAVPQCDKGVAACVTSSFRREVDGICALVGYYEACSDSSLPTFWNQLSVPSSGVEKSKKTLEGGTDKSERR